MKTINSLKTVAFALGLAAMTLPATTLNAQGRPGGLFGTQNAPTEAPVGGLMGDRSYSSGALNINVNVEGFGGENGGGEGGFNIGTEQFGDNETPLGSGLFIMAAAGAAYAFSKKRKKQENN